MNAIDILLPLGNGSCHRNIELRFALRSIMRHARGWRRVVIVGENPGFLSRDPRVAFFPCSEVAGNKEFKIAAKLLWAFQNTDCSDYVAMWNDDYVLTDTVDVRKIGFYHRGSLVEASFRHSETRYKQALRLTHDQLRAAGLPAFHYDIHLPMIYHRTLFTHLSPWWERSRASECGLVVKSVYANNVLDKPGPITTDCKLRTCRNMAHIEQVVRGRWCFSYSDQSLQSGLLPLLNEWYPEPCALEAVSPP